MIKSSSNTLVKTDNPLLPLVPLELVAPCVIDHQLSTEDLIRLMRKTLAAVFQQQPIPGDSFILERLGIDLPKTPLSVTDFRSHRTCLELLTKFNQILYPRGRLIVGHPNASDSEPTAVASFDLSQMTLVERPSSPICFWVPCSFAYAPLGYFGLAWGRYAFVDVKGAYQDAQEFIESVPKLATMPRIDSEMPLLVRLDALLKSRKSLERYFTAAGPDRIKGEELCHCDDRALLGDPLLMGDSPPNWQILLN